MMRVLLSVYHFSLFTSRHIGSDVDVINPQPINYEYVSLYLRFHWFVSIPSFHTWSNPMLFWVCVLGGMCISILIINFNFLRLNQKT